MHKASVSVIFFYLLEIWNKYVLSGEKNLEVEKSQCLTKFTSVLYVASITSKFLVLILLDFSVAFDIVVQSSVWHSC